MRKMLPLILLLATSGSAHAQQAQRESWNALYSLRAGEKIEVVETGMKKHVGTFATVTDEAIEIRETSGDVGIRKENIARVTLLAKSHRLRNVLIFGAVGLGVGIGIGAAANPNDSLARDGAMAFGAIIGLAGGAGIGAALPAHPTVYRAEPAKSVQN